MAEPNMRLITPDGVIAARVKAADDRTLVAQHANAVAKFVRTGDSSDLAQFEDVEVQGHVLLTDLDELEAWAAQGELEFEDIYSATGR
jgi:hypothetical protein